MLAKESKLTSERGKLFASIILSAAAVKSKRHHKWLWEIRVSERNYVMVNPDDILLRFAGILLKPNMPGSEINRPEIATEHGSYIHLGKLVVNHRYFVVPKQKSQNNLKEFFVQALTGKNVNLDLLSNRKEKDGVEVFSVKPNG